jgi:trans-2,3-dihydro-3-hydroxyanthranilate isomerase
MRNNTISRREFGGALLAGAGVVAAAAVDRPLHAQAGGHAYRYIHLDVFTDKRLAGNQLLVFVTPAGLDTDAMQGFTRESNYSECTFVFPPEQPGTDHRVRIFTRTAETPFAGHPTIGTAFALAHASVLKPSMAKTTFGLGAGPTPIDLEWKGNQLAFAWMTQQKPTFGKTIDDAGALAAAIGVGADAVRPKPEGSGSAPIPAAQEVYSGSTFVIVPLATRKAVDAAVLDRAKVDAVFSAAGVQRRGLYVFSTERGQDDVTAYSRLLSAGGIEDPATGSAAGPAGCFLAKYGFVPPDRAESIVFLQGVQVRRPSRLHVRVSMSGGDVTGVKVGGTSVVVGEGTMEL